MLSSSIQVSFQHMGKSANGVADTLNKKGVERVTTFCAVGGNGVVLLYGII